MALANAVQEVKISRLGQFLRLGHADAEVVPWHHRLDCRVGIGTVAFGLEQRLSDAPVEPHLVVGRFVLGLKLLLVLVLCGGEQFADNAVVQVNGLVGDGGNAFDNKCYERRVAPLRLELG